MKNTFALSLCAICGLVRKTASRFSALRLFAVIALSLALLAVIPHLIGQAQRNDVPGKVWNLAVQPSAGGTVVWITADAPLGRRPQNWQDSEGFHVVLPNTVSGESLRTVPGVKFRRLGTSLEVLLQTKPGSKVSLRSEGNEISLVVDKTLEARSDVDSRPDNSTQTPPAVRDPASASASPAEGLSSNWNAPMGPTTELPAGKLPPEGVTNPSQPDEESKIKVEGKSALASIFSATSVFVVTVLGAFGLLVSRKLRSRRTQAPAAEKELSEDADSVEDQTPEGRLRMQNEFDAPGTSLVKSGGAGGRSRQSKVRSSISGPSSFFSAYRIDNEVGQLLLGQPHRKDVLASRATDDRRAIETSLIKGMNAPGLDEAARLRTRKALEEYGFVARQCAALLLASDAFERTSAARLLGEIKSDAALPFLLESLYDSESIVRNQAVVSIGELKLPSAIGALLDMAKRYPDIPSALLSRTLSACSVEGLDSVDAKPIKPAETGHDRSIVDQITHLEPASSVEELPESSDDEHLVQALMLSSSEDAHERAEALKTLAQFRIQSSVDSLSRIARTDPEPNLRSMAVSSLGSIDHESAFPAILIGMADESREVRAAAARALNRLSFDRADAYVRVIEAGDQDTIGKVAKACVQAGIVSQNLDRLASSDHRQTYETFSLICLLARANLNDPILDAIASHPIMDVRSKTVHLLASTGQPETLEHLRQLAVREGVTEEVKTALLEAMYKLEQKSKRQEKETIEASEADSEPQFETPEAESFESNSELGFALAFEPTTQPEVQAEFQTEAGREQEQLER